MAIRIPILTSFDPKGLKQANAAFANLQTSIGSLGKNFAIAGAGIVGATALLGKAVMSASNFEAEFEGVNQVFKEAAGSVQAFAEQASKTAGLSATEALRASKTFGLFATGAGLGVGAAANFSTTMVQLAGDLGSFNDVPTADALAAIQSGLMGQAEPLRNFGVFLDEGRLKQALFNATGKEVVGTLSTQEKMMAAYYSILEQTTVQQGDFVKYQDTLGNQLKTISQDFENLTKDIGMMLIPVITEAMPVIQQMSVEIGEKLKAAIGAIDWKSLIQSVVDFGLFLVTNAESIAKLVAAIFVLNTAYKLMTVVSGITTLALKIQDWWVGKVAAGMTLATIATNLLSAAMRLIPFVLVATAIGLVVTGIVQMGNAANQTKPYVDNYGGAIRKSGDDALWAAQRYGTAANAANTLGNSLAYVQGIQNKLTPRQADEQARRAGTEFIRVPKIDLPSFSSPSAATAAPAAMTQSLQDLISAQQLAANQEQGILDQRVSAFESFNDSVKSLFGQIRDSIMSSFNLPTLGGSVNSITRNIAKLLERTKNFARSISQLSGMGLNSALLQQVIQAGPMAGSQLAAALVSGGGSFIGQLNQAYSEFGNIASGIAGSGVVSAFANPTVSNTYNIEVNGGVGSGPSMGKAIVDAIKAYERTSGAVWQGA